MNSKNHDFQIHWSWRSSQVLRPHPEHLPIPPPSGQCPLQHSSFKWQKRPFVRQLTSLEDWTAQGKRKSSQAAAWKTVSPAFVWADATCSRFTSTPPTPSSSSRAASVTCTITSMMQAMASRWTADVETLKVVIVMIAKPFSLNKHSNQNTCKRNTGSMERGAYARFLFFPNSTASQIWWFLHI